MLLRRSLAHTTRATEPRPLDNRLMGTHNPLVRLPKGTHKSMHRAMRRLQDHLSTGTEAHRRVSLVTPPRVDRPRDGSNTLGNSAGIE